MGISEIFGTSFAVLRKNPKIVWPIFLFTLVVTALSLALTGVFVPLNSISAYSTPFSTTSGTMPFSSSQILAILPTLFGLIGLIVLVSFFVGLLVDGIYISIAEQGYKKQKISLSTAWKVATGAYLRLLAAAVIYVIILFVIAVIFVLILIGAFLIPSHALHIVAALLLAVIGFVVFAFIGIAFYELYVVVILEKRDPVDAIKRTIDIGRRYWGELLAVLIISIVIAVVINLIGSLIGVAAGLVLGFAGTTAALIVRELIQLVITSFVASWISLVPVFFYHEYVAYGSKKMKK